MQTLETSFYPYVRTKRPELGYVLNIKHKEAIDLIAMLKSVQTDNLCLNFNDEADDPYALGIAPELAEYILLASENLNEDIVAILKFAHNENMNFNIVSRHEKTNYPQISIHSKNRFMPKIKVDFEDGIELLKMLGLNQPKDERHQIEYHISTLQEALEKAKPQNFIQKDLVERLKEMCRYIIAKDLYPQIIAFN